MMRHLLFGLMMVVSTSISAQAVRPFMATVTGLPTVCNPGHPYIVTDAASLSDCATGSSASAALCSCNSSGDGYVSFIPSTSAELSASLSDETGSGVVVFGTSPTIATPSITGDVSPPGNWDFGGDVTATSFEADPVSIPSVVLKDLQAADGDDNARFYSNCTDTGSGTEDCDLTLAQQEAGTEKDVLIADADAGITVGSSSNNSLTITTDGTGTAEVVLPAGAIDSTEILDGTVDISADTNMSAGRSLTLSGDSVIADAELYTDEKCFYIEDPVSAEQLETVWRAPTALTITEIYGEATAGTSVAFDFNIDDGTPAGVNGSDITATTSGVTDSTFAGDTTMAAGDRLDIDIGTVTGVVEAVSLCARLTKDD